MSRIEQHDVSEGEALELKDFVCGSVADLLEKMTDHVDQHHGVVLTGTLLYLVDCVVRSHRADVVNHKLYQGLAETAIHGLMHMAKDEKQHQRVTDLKEHGFSPLDIKLRD